MHPSLAVAASTQAERDYDLNRAAELKYGTLIELQKRLKKAEETLVRRMSTGNRMLREEVTEDDIASIVSRWTGIPVNKLQTSEKEKLLNLGEELHKRVVGQVRSGSRGAHDNFFFLLFLS